MLNKQEVAHISPFYQRPYTHGYLLPISKIIHWFYKQDYNVSSFFMIKKICIAVPSKIIPGGWRYKIEYSNNNFWVDSVLGLER